MGVVHVVLGGTGDQTGAIAGNGGAWETGYQATFANFQGADGGAVVSQGVGTITEGTGSKVRITPTAGDFAGAKSGHHVSVDFVADYTDGRYLILVVDGGDAWIEIDYAYNGGNDQNVTTAIVGGSLPVTKTGFDDGKALVTGGNYLDFCVGNDPGGSGTTGKMTIATGLSHSVSGSEPSRIMVRGVDLSGDVLTRADVLPIITTTTGALGYLLTNAVTDYIDYIAIDFNGGGSGKATNCIYSVAPLVTDWRFYDCLFHNSNGDCVSWLNKNATFEDSDVFDSVTGDGLGKLGIDGTVTNCRGYGNATDGFVLAYGDANGGYNQAFENGQDGFSFGSGIQYGSAVTTWRNCSSYGNTRNGFYWIAFAGTRQMTFYNNTASSNGGDNYIVADDDAGWFDSAGEFYYNHNHDGTFQLGAGEWAGLVGGNNIAGDPLFVSTVADNIILMPLFASPLVGAGNGGTTIGALNPGGNYPEVEDVRLGVEYAVGDDTAVGTLVVPPATLIGTGGLIG